MTKLSLFFKSYIPERIESSSGDPITSYVNGQSRLPLIPLFPKSFCSYATDQGDSSRLLTRVEITFNGQMATKVATSSRCHPSTQYPGILSLNRSPQTIQATPRLKWGEHKSCQYSAHVHFKTTAANPFFKYCGLNLAPKIQTQYTLHIKSSNSSTNDKPQYSLFIDGQVSLFPAHKIDYSFDDGEPLTLLDVKPEPGRTPFDLFRCRTQRMRYQGDISEKTTHATPSNDVHYGI